MKQINIQYVSTLGTMQIKNEPSHKSMLAFLQKGAFLEKTG